MRACVQRVRRCAVSVDNTVVGSIGMGLLVLLGIASDDTEQDGAWIARKLARLRVFSDIDGRLQYALRDVNGGVLIVSQWTLYGDCHRSHRPDGSCAANPVYAQSLYDAFLGAVENEIGFKPQTGIFGASMEIDMIALGPVTIIVDTARCMWKKSV